MKKLMILMMFGVLVLTGCGKETDYYCRIESHNGAIKDYEYIDFYKVEGDIMTLTLKNGVKQEYSSEEYVITCTEMEEIK